MGIIIAIEGIDGSGKNTQSTNLLEEYLSAGAQATKISFPQYGSTLFGKEVGNYLNGDFGSLSEVHPKLSAMLYAGDRFESKNEILAKSANNAVLICDRYVHSNVAHQTAKVPKEDQVEFRNWIEKLEYEVYGIPKPDLVIFLNVPPKTSTDLVLKKSTRDYTTKKKDLHEADDIYLEKVYELFKSEAEHNRNWLTIDCFHDGKLLDEEAIFNKIKTELTKRKLL
ncbi:Thymidylate kinase [Pseudomonas fluorescens]|nr:Thymidylate kinase [Pseudomonas fluorescens]